MTYASPERSRRSARQIVCGIAAAFALLLAVAGLPALLYAAAGIPIPHHVPSPGQLTHTLTRRDDGTLFLSALLVVAWVGWAIFTISVVLEVIAQVRGRAVRRLPGLALSQQIAGAWVAAVAVLLLTSPQLPVRSAPHDVAALLPLRAPMVMSATLDAPIASSNGHRTPTATPAPPATIERASVEKKMYDVRRGDTLWDIADRHLGDPERWREIARLNYDRPQPDGRSLTNSHWIYPGWRLLLPADATGLVDMHAPTADPAPSNGRAEARAAMPPAGAAHEHRHPSAEPVAHHSTRSTWVELETGSRLGGSFAAGVLAALAVERARRRRRYRPQPPAPGRGVATREPLGKALWQLRNAARDVANDDSPTKPSVVTEIVSPNARVEPDLIEVGERDGEPVCMRLTGRHGLRLSGQGADGVARAWLAALMTRAGPYGVEILAEALLLDGLLPVLPPTPALHRLSDTAALLRDAEALRVGRTRLFEDANVSDADTYRRQHPENPLPAVILLTRTIEPSLLTRWRAVLDSGSRFGIDALVLTEADATNDDVNASIHVDADGGMQNAHPQQLDQQLRGTRLFTLHAEDATELLAPIAETHQPTEPDPGPVIDLTQTRAVDMSVGSEAQPDTSGPNGNRESEAPGDAQSVTEPWPDVPILSPSQAIVSVQLLGPPTLRVSGQEVASGLRASARELLAWFLMRPDGATAETAIDAIWPDVAPERGPQRFWTALGNLRSRLREVGDHPVDVLVKAGEHYHPEFDVLDVDVWRFQSAVNDATHANDAASMVEALARAADMYRGDLVDGTDYPWIEPLREDLHRRALDVYVRLAELQSDADDIDAAIQTLEQAIKLDPIAEELYRRLMELLARAGRTDAIKRLWARLTGALADLDLDPEPQTASVMRRLTTRTASV
jgi:DNA-binding SARP family transcriptional activator